MNLDISLPLLSELEQISAAFWKNHSQQNQDETPVTCEQNLLETLEENLRPELCSDKANSHTEPNECPQHHSQDSKADKDVNGEQHANGNGVRTSQDTNSPCCESVDSDSGKSESESHEECIIKGQTKSQHEPSAAGRSNRTRRTCRVLWERSTEDSSVL